jgi:hypothetical protein
MTRALRESLRESCGKPAGKRESWCGGSLPIGDPHTHHTPTNPQPHPSDRWPLVCALLVDPDTESRRLVDRLSAWACQVQVHRIAGAGDVWREGE